MPLSMAEAFVETALECLAGNTRPGRLDAFRRGNPGLIQKTERTTDGTAITFHDHSMLTLEIRPGRVRMAIHHSVPAGPFAGLRRIPDPDPPGQWVEASPQGPEGMRAMAYLEGMRAMAHMAGPERK